MKIVEFLTAASVMVVSVLIPTGRSASTFIVGGEAAERNELPYQISLRRDGKHICGGAIVAMDSIVTAAHCLELGSLASFTVVAGEYSFENNDGTEQETNVSALNIHPSYDPWTLANDIAVVKLGNVLNITQAVRTIDIASAGQQSSGNATVSGWGSSGDEDNDKISDILLKVQVPLVTDSTCRDAYPMLILDQMLCAGSSDGGKDACRGDAGDPLVCNDNNGNAYLCGIFSWGHSICGEPEFPGVYTEIAYFFTWINESIRRA